MSSGLTCDSADILTVAGKATIASRNLGGEIVRRFICKQIYMNKNAENVLENNIVWSNGRVEMLGKCARRYFHNYIQSWEGWDTEKAPEVQAAYRVKHLTTVELQIGNIVHDQIRTIFHNAISGRVAIPTTDIRIAQERLKSFISLSSTRRLEELSARRQKLLLHELGKTLAPAELEAHLEEIEDLLTSFFSFPDVKLLLADPSLLLRDYLDPAGFDINEALTVPARPKTDAVFFAPDRLVVADWKTGNPSDIFRARGLIYDIFVRRSLMLATDDVVEVRFYYLKSGRVESHVFCEDERSEKIWEIQEQFHEFQRLSDDSVINVGPEARFKPSVSKNCFQCMHRLMCEPFLASPFAKAPSEVV